METRPDEAKIRKLERRAAWLEFKRRFALRETTKCEIDSQLLNIGVCIGLYKRESEVRAILNELKEDED